MEWGGRIIFFTRKGGLYLDGVWNIDFFHLFWFTLRSYVRKLLCVREYSRGKTVVFCKSDSSSVCRGYSDIWKLQAKMKLCWKHIWMTAPCWLPWPLRLPLKRYSFRRAAQTMECWLSTWDSVVKRKGIYKNIMCSWAYVTHFQGLRRVW